jgi:uncharacterized protein YecE (DUF72 family)
MAGRGRTHGEMRIGTSGYQYDHWRDLFYPPEEPRRRWFEFYAERFDTVEINNSFYRLPAAHTFASWASRAPRGFIYAVKYSRFGSHMKRLKDPESHIGLFLERAAALNGTLGPILVQLPPKWKADVPRLADFLAAARAAGKRQRWAIEVRATRWLIDDVYDALHEHDAALVVHDMIRGHPREITAEWMYLRYHGRAGTKEGNYTPAMLGRESRRIRADLRAGRDVYAYFNNDQHAFAVFNALDLRRLIEGKQCRRRAA